MKKSTLKINDSELYLTPECTVITMRMEGMLCDSDESDGGIDSWHFSDDPITF